MKVILIRPPQHHMISTNVPESVDTETGMYPPLGLLYVAAGLGAWTNAEVELLDAPALLEPPALLETRAVRTSSLISCSFRMECQPCTPRFFAIWARSFCVYALSFAGVIEMPPIVEMTWHPSRPM